MKEYKGIQKKVHQNTPTKRIPCKQNVTQGIVTKGLSKLKP